MTGSEKESILSANGDSVRATPGTWQEQLRRAIRTQEELRALLGIAADQDKLSDAGRAADQFPVFVPPAWLEKIRPGDPDDPLLRQVLAAADEMRPAEGFTVDPLAESGMQPRPGLLQKYAGRVLLIVAGSCGINCRYCFRRHFPYDTAPRTEDQLAAAFDSLRGDEGVREVILSGGDPLMLTDTRLEWIIRQVSGLEQVQRLRIHTRMPVAIPQRVTGRLVRMLRETRLATAVVIHANHPRELGVDVESALRGLRDGSRVTLLNQSVLLRGVNDRVEVLMELSERLFECGVLPYYLHQLDRVAGAGHFLVPDAEARGLVEKLRNRLPGYLVPLLVREEPGRGSKTPL